MWWWIGVALAGECRWPGEVDVVSARMTALTIEGETLQVTGRERWSSLAADFRECDWNRAATALERWRANRRATNVTATIGAVVVWPVLIGTVFTATAAGRWRSDLVEAILQESEDEGEGV